VNQQLLQLVSILWRRIFGCHQHTEHGLFSPVIRVMHGKDDLLHGIFYFYDSISFASLNCSIL